MQGRKAVIDGQQRLATTCLLLGAIRDEYRLRDEERYADSIHGDYIGRFDRDAGNDQPMLILNTDDRDFVQRFVVERDASARPVGSSQEMLAASFEFLSKKVREFCAEAGATWKARLDQFVKYLDESAQVIVISVATEADAFLIFETLNDRGADLTVADLLKNFLFSQSATRLDEVRDAWTKTLSALETPSVGNTRFNLFARHYMSSRRGVVRERELYARIKDEVSSPATCVEFANELVRNAHLYAAILSTDSEYWGDYDEPVRAGAQVLTDLSLEQSRPMLLAVLATWQQAEISRFLTAMVSWSVRGLASGVLGAGQAERAFCLAAKDIRAGRFLTAEAILKEPHIDALIPTDAAFEAAFADWRVTRGAVARYLLRCLEMQQRGDAEPELVVNSDPEKLNLEHILPKSPRQSDWPHFDADEQKLLLHRIGNLCLLQKGPNGRIGNKPWTAKQPVLAASS